MEGKFKLTIDLGNDAMSERSDVIEALGRVMMRLADGSSTEGYITDRNGNTVGSWEVTG